MFVIEKKKLSKELLLVGPVLLVLPLNIHFLAGKY
jgi:hypothetical protein